LGLGWGLGLGLGLGSPRRAGRPGAARDGRREQWHDEPRQFERGVA
jgi:hypothetical protein